jgi:hypothetical protein
MSENDDAPPTKSNLIITGGDGDATVVAHQAMKTATELRPCQRCSRWEDDKPKLVRFLNKRGCVVDPSTGTISSLVHKDFRGRVGMTLNIMNVGYCRRESSVTEREATCGDWKPADKLAAKIGAR